MLNILKKLLTLLLCLLILVIILFFSLGNNIVDYFIQDSLKKVNTEELDIEVNSPSLHFFKFSIANLTINKKVKFLNLPIEFKKIDFEPNIFSLLSNQKKFKLYSNFYSGQLKLNGGYFKDTGKISSKINLEGALLETHKLFKQFGIKGGNLSSVCSEFEMDHNQLNKASCKFTLLNLNQPNNLSIPSSISGLPLKINIPAVKVKELKFDFDLSPKKTELKNLLLISDLGNLNGNLELRNGAMDLNLELLGRGVSEFGPLLRAFANSSKNSNKFSIKTTKHFRDLKIRARM